MSKVITDDKVLALAQHLGVKPSKISDGGKKLQERETYMMS